MRKIAVAVAVAIVIAAASSLLQNEAPAPQAPSSEPVAKTALSPGVRSETTADDLAPTVEQTPAGSEDRACFSIAQLETHPALFAETARLERVASSGEFLEPLEHASETYLRQLATQGNAAAMLVLGAKAELAADGKNPEDAVRLLAYKVSTSAMFPNEPPDGEALKLLDDAAQWYYQAALHGRIMALQNYGRVRGAIAGGPIGLGWVSEPDYAAMSQAEKNALLPGNVYGKLTSRIAPELDSGLGQLFPRLLPTSHRQALVVEELFDEFEQRREAAGLPPISVPASDFWSEDDLLDLVCESDLEHLL